MSLTNLLNMLQASKIQIRVNIMRDPSNVEISMLNQGNQSNHCLYQLVFKSFFLSSILVWIPIKMLSDFTSVVSIKTAFFSICQV